MLLPKYVAAIALSKALSDHGIKHAFIGGFALSLLGSSRGTEAIDVLVDLPRDELRQRIGAATAHDPRFVKRGLKFAFQPENAAVVPISTLPTGDLGLPRSCNVLLVGEHNLPVLQPGILVLAKCKQCFHILKSTRPQSVAKLEGDILDIVHLLEWIASNDKTVDFAGYDVHGSEREQLYRAVRKLAWRWFRKVDTETLAKLKATLAAADAEKIFV